MDKLKSGIKIPKFVNVQAQHPITLMENVLPVMDHLNGELIWTLVNSKSILAQLHQLLLLKLLQSPQLPQLPQLLQLPHLLQLPQQLKAVLQTLFGTATFKSVFVHQIFLSMMVLNVFNVTYLNIGTMIWSNVFTVKETNISTQFQELVNHVQLINHYLETIFVKLVHQIQLMMQHQTHVKRNLLIQQHRQKFQFIQQQPPQQPVIEKIKNWSLDKIYLNEFNLSLKSYLENNHVDNL